MRSSDRRDKLAEVIRSSADGLLTIINDILDFSKIEAGKLSLERLDFDLIDTIESTLELLAGSANAKGVELAGAMDSGLPNCLLGELLPPIATFRIKLKRLMGVFAPP